MKSDFLLALTQLSAEKNLPREVVVSAVETALVSAYRKNSFTANQNIAVKISPTTGKVEVWAEKTIVERPSDKRCEISLAEAQHINPESQLGGTIIIEDTPHHAGRIAAQTAKQVILQRLHEAEHSAIFEEFVDREGDIVAGMIRRIEPKQIFIDLGRTEAILPVIEQMPNERYRVGQRLKVYLLEVAQTSREPRVIVSRSHPNLLRRLFESEVPEVYSGTVEIKSVAREAGYRSKVAVVAKQDGIDPVGCCVGLRGIRIQNIVSELSGEKIDVVLWSSQVGNFIASALSPAQVLGVDLNEGEKVAKAIIPDKQLSLAIGREGQNVRLAAKLTEWRIDIKSASDVEAQKLEEAEKLVEAAEDKGTMEDAAVVEEISSEMSIIESETLVELPGMTDDAEVLKESPPASDGISIPQGVPFEPDFRTEATGEKLGIRFAEDIMTDRPVKPEAKSRKKKKKGGEGKGSAVDGIKLKKINRGPQLPISEEDEY